MTAALFGQTSPVELLHRLGVDINALSNVCVLLSLRGSRCPDRLAAAGAAGRDSAAFSRARRPR
jgi:hypothetical protein